ncbi:hypothetical protein UFOVP46_94 [uncultured Caudovirales phage]|uniref:Uncharacterized protein n=1 Tax=uncultured Caudovirales phage TaxID=2100421 RepID=A0A6J5KS92_9CAUD|nr:hypothetical protein UFOVP46_94 [uncultured Caudovirales phage]
MAQVQEVIEWLSKLDPEETIALTGWWIKSDVEHNNDIKLSDDQWDAIVDMHESNIERHIDDVVAEVLEEGH